VAETATSHGLKLWLSRHAFERCGQRFPGLDPYASLARSVRVAWRKVRKAQAKQHGGHLPIRAADKAVVVFLVDREAGAVWVARNRYGKGRTLGVVTVLDLEV
jgi:hypothetical protein